MGRLVAIEGLDGAGKRTLVQRILAESGLRIATMAFPRYRESVTADLVRDALYGRLGDLSDSVYGCAVLFALDRQAAMARMDELLAGHDVLLMDRYISSNAAYGSARLGAPTEPTTFPEWLRELEIERLGIPAPDRQILLDVPVDVAAGRASSRAGSEADRALDRFEADAGLQHRTGAMYRRLAESSYLSEWVILRPGPQGEIALSADVLG